MTGYFSRFLIVGAFNTCFGYAIIFSAMYGIGLSPEMSNILGYAVAVVASFALNRTYTFKSTGRAPGEMGRFLAVFGVAFSANLIVLHVLVRILLVHEAVSQLLSGVVYVGLSYFMNKRFVFFVKRADVPEDIRNNLR